MADLYLIVRFARDAASYSCVRYALIRSRLHVQAVMHRVHEDLLWPRQHTVALQAVERDGRVLIPLLERPWSVTVWRVVALL